MIDPARRRRFTFREYLDLEEVSNTKHEYAGSEIYAMAGGSPAHAAVAMALGAHLLGQLAGRPCRVYSSDLRVRVMATGLATYPDVSVVCGPLALDPESATTVTNPTLVAEVLSKSTADYDRGEKLEAYQRIPALKAVLLLASDEPSIELVERIDEGWARRRGVASEVLAIAAIDVSIDVDAVYAVAGVS